MAECVSDPAGRATPLLTTRLIRSLAAPEPWRDYAELLTAERLPGAP